MGVRRCGWTDLKPVTPYVFTPPYAAACVGMRWHGLSDAADRYASNRAHKVPEAFRQERLAALVEAAERANFVASKRGFLYRPRDVIAALRTRLAARPPAQQEVRPARPPLAKPAIVARLSFPNRE